MKDTIAPRPFGTIDALNAQIQTTRRTWLGVWTVLAVIGLTLATFADSDFFLNDRLVRLSLINVQVPSLLFFAFGPAISFSLYLIAASSLLKLGKASVRLPAITDGRHLSEDISPSLLSNLVLSFRPDHALRRGTFGRISIFATYLLVFLALPAIMTAFWIRSMPAHNILLTLLGCGVPLVASTLTSFGLLWRLKQMFPSLEPKPPIAGKTRTFIAFVLFVSIGALSFLTTEGTTERIFAGRWPAIGTTALLYPANLQNVVFVRVPADWVDYAQARRDFAHAWCEQNDMAADVCHIPHATATPPPVDQLRATWCSEHLPTSQTPQETCQEHFRVFMAEMDMAWRASRKSQVDRLPHQSFANTDLRNAVLIGAELTGANLEEARLQGADLSKARLEGANLHRTNLQGATVEDAALQGARLSNAQLSGANFTRSNLQDANLRRSIFDNATLRRTLLQGADLSHASLVGANLQEAQLNRTNLSQANLEHANLEKAQMAQAVFVESLLTGANLSRANLERAAMRGAQLQGANLQRADLTGANVQQARLDGSILSGANLAGADFQSSNLDNALLWGTMFDTQTILRDTSFHGASVKASYLRDTPLITDYLSQVFGDASVILPGSLGPDSPDWPVHWPKENLGRDDFLTQWRAWQATLPPDTDQ